jgi:hypothetical protein
LARFRFHFALRPYFASCFCCRYPLFSSQATGNRNTMSQAAAAASKINTSNTAAGEYLLERLRILLNRLQAATEILHKWPEAGGDSAKIHNETATE